MSYSAAPGNSKSQFIRVQELMQRTWNNNLPTRTSWNRITCNPKARSSAWTKVMDAFWKPETKRATAISNRLMFYFKDRSLLVRSRRKLKAHRFQLFNILVGFPDNGTDTSMRILKVDSGISLLIKSCVWSSSKLIGCGFLWGQKISKCMKVPCHLTSYRN